MLLVEQDQVGYYVMDRIIPQTLEVDLLLVIVILMVIMMWETLVVQKLIQLLFLDLIQLILQSVELLVM